MISASPEVLDLCKQVLQDPSFWTLVKPQLAEAFVPLIVFTGIVLMLILAAFVANFFEGSGI